MPKKLRIQYIRDRLPVVYRYHQGYRWFMIFLSFLIVVYSIYFMTRFVNSDTPTFFKMVPMVICFVSLDSILRKITNLNSITFTQEGLRFGYIAKKPLYIPYEDIQSLDLLRKVSYYMQLTYRDKHGKVRQIKTPASFPYILEIIFNVADLAKSAVIPEKMQSVLEYLKENVENEI